VRLNCSRNIELVLICSLRFTPETFWVLMYLYVPSIVAHVVFRPELKTENREFGYLRLNSTLIPDADYSYILNGAH
jgi:hypothetical protein